MSRIKWSTEKRRLIIAAIYSVYQGDLEILTQLSKGSKHNKYIQSCLTFLRETETFKHLGSDDALIIQITFASKVLLGGSGWTNKHQKYSLDYQRIAIEILPTDN